MPLPISAGEPEILKKIPDLPPPPFVELFEGNQDYNMMSPDCINSAKSHKNLIENHLS
jgi:hypothetical protein